MENKTTFTFKDSLKSWDTENLLDRVFYRPIGFKVAKALTSTSITPNTVTVVSIFIGMIGCGLFYPKDIIWINLVGFILLVIANILDCVDGQLARMTGIKSEIGRILDGFSGDMWFIVFYLVLTFRLINFEGWGWWTILIALASGMSHFAQAGIVDLYKTFHLHMLRAGKNSEFETSKQILSKYKSFTWKNELVVKSFFRLYYYYTIIQELRTPKLHHYAKALNEKYPDGIPEEKISKFREKSLKLMPLLDSFTFNSRSLLILLTLLINIEWIYFVIEIFILNPLLFIAIRKHEKMCSEFEKDVLN